MLQEYNLLLVWKRHTCLTKPEFIHVILPHISTARLEHPVEKIPIYFQKRIKAFRLWSADLSSKCLEKIHSAPLSLTPMAPSSNEFQSSWLPLPSGRLSLYSSPLPELLMHLISAQYHPSVISVYSSRGYGEKFCKTAGLVDTVY